MINMANHLSAPTPPPTDDTEALQFGLTRLRVVGSYSINKRAALPCLATAITDQGLHLRVMAKPAVGDRLLAVFDIMGRVEGVVEQIMESMVVIQIAEEIRRNLAKQLSYSLKKKRDGDERRHLRVTPQHNQTSIRTEQKKVFRAMIEDMSISGASIFTHAPLSIGDVITFQRLTRAKIVRNDENSRFGVEFEKYFRPQEFAWRLRL